MADISKVKLNGTSYNIKDSTAVHTVDSSLSSSSTNPVQNKVVTEALSGKLGTNEKAASATTADSASSVPWTGVTGKPTSFSPSSHKHGMSYSYNTTTHCLTLPVNSNNN